MTTEQTNPLETATPTDQEQAHTSEEVSQVTDTGQTAEGTEQPQEPKETPKPKTDWAQRRIDQLTREKYEERRQREALEQQIAAQRPPAEQGQQPPATADAIRAEAQRIVAQERFNDACNRVFQAGVKESPEFETNLRTLQTVGEVSRDFLEAITEMDAGHKVLNHLGANPEVAERVLAMPPMKQAMELARIEASIAKSAPPPVSKAPPPITPVGGRASPVEPENETVEQYIARRKQQLKR